MLSVVLIESLVTLLHELSLHPTILNNQHKYQRSPHQALVAGSFSYGSYLNKHNSVVSATRPDWILQRYNPAETATPESSLPFH